MTIPMTNVRPRNLRDRIQTFGVALMLCGLLACTGGGALHRFISMMEIR